MADRHSRSKGLGFGSYTKRFRHRFWRDSAPWARDNIFWGIAVLVIPPLAVYLKDRGATLDWATIKAALVLYAVALGIYIVYHLGRTAWKVDQEREDDVLSLEGERDNAEEELAVAMTGPHFVGHFYQFQVFPRTGIVDPEMMQELKDLVYDHKKLPRKDVVCDYDVFVEAYVQNDTPGRGSILEYVFEIEIDGTYIQLECEFNFKGWILEREQSEMDANNWLTVVKANVTKPIPDLSIVAAGVLEQGKGVEGWLHYVLKNVAHTEFDGVKKHDIVLTINDGKGISHKINTTWIGEPRPWRIRHDLTT